MSQPELPLTFEPLTSERWNDLEALFGPRGACGGCWCMTWRLTRAEYERGKGDGNREAFRAVVASGAPVGLLAYAGNEPIGWCAIAPREDFPALERSRILKRVDDEPVWSVVCFFVKRGWRRRGISTRLLTAAIDFAAEHGARIVEGYPVEPRKAEMPPVFAWTGLTASFRQAGFVEVARRSEKRPIMRYEIAESTDSP
jgi:GNAT superfamily N-acetyltransferase